jgi:hypothetical protein
MTKPKHLYIIGLCHMLIYRINSASFQFWFKFLTFLVLILINEKARWQRDFLNLIQ